MAMQPPAAQPTAATPITAAIPAAPSAPAAAAPTGQPEAPATQAAPAPVTPPAPQTLQDVLAARKAALTPSGQTTATSLATLPVDPNAPTPPVVPPVENANPVQTPVDPATAAKDQMFELFQKNPQQLMAMLQAAQGVSPVAQPETPAAPVVTPEAYAQNMQTEAQQFLANRPRITAESMFGAENAEEMGLKGTDFTEDLEQFVHLTIAPVIGNLLSNMFNLQHNFNHQFQQVQPVLQSHQFTEVQREAGKNLAEAFPALAQGDANARVFADKRFNELAPIMLAPEILNNPQSNPKEYARIMTIIAKIAASEYSTLTPANTPTAPPMMPAPATVPPEPQPIVPTYRNHMGQFQANVAPRTLDEFNQRRIATLFPNR